VDGLIGPLSPESAVHVRNICDMKEIPLIETIIDGSSKHVINLHPTPEELGKAYLDMITHWGWEGFTIVYENAAWLPLVDYIINNYKLKFKITVRELDEANKHDYRFHLRNVKTSEDKNIVICSSSENLHTILTHAQQVGLMTDQHRFLITSLDLHTIDLEAFKYSGTNITGFRLIPESDSDVNYFIKQLNTLIKEEDDDDAIEYTIDNMDVSSALIFDAVYLFNTVYSKDNVAVRQEDVSCFDKQSILTNGFSIFNSMKIERFKGISGHIQFDQQGNREKIQLRVQELATEGLKIIGHWNESSKIQTVNYKPPDNSNDDVNSLQNKTLKVITSLVC
jgi:hypothetical protein